MAVTIIDGVNKIQIRNAKNGDFDLNLAGGGGSGGDGKPLFPTVKVEIGDSVVATILNQGQLISNVNVEVHAGGNIYPFLCGTICLNIGEGTVIRYFLDIGNNVMFELSVDESNQEILSVSQVSAEISVITYFAASCEPHKVYYTTYGAQLTIGGTTQRARFTRLPLGIAEIVGIQNVYIADSSSSDNGHRCLLAYLGSTNKDFTQYEKIGVIRTVE